MRGATLINRFIRQPRNLNDPPTTSPPSPATQPPTRKIEVSVGGSSKQPPTPPRLDMDGNEIPDYTTMDDLRPDSTCPKCADPRGFWMTRPTYIEDFSDYATHQRLEWACRTCGYLIKTRTADGTD